MKEKIFVDQFTDLIKLGIFESNDLIFFQLDDFYNNQQIQIRLDKEQIKELFQKIEKYLKEDKNQKSIENSFKRGN